MTTLIRPGLAAVLVALFGALAVPAAQAVDPEPIARIGDIDVRADDVRAFLETLDAREQSALARDPGLLSQAVRQLLARKLVFKAALAQKWEQKPAVAAQIERARESVIAETYLQSISRPADAYPSDAEVDAAYEANKTAFLVPRQYRLAQIFIAVPKDADKPAQEKARRKLDEALRKLKQKGADFQAIAATESEDPEAATRRGEIGWLAESQLVPEIRAQVIGLAKDGTTEPLRLDDGWHVVKLLDTTPASTRPLTEIRDQLAERMRAERIQANRRAYLSKLLQENPPAVNELALSKLLGRTER